MSNKLNLYENNPIANALATKWKPLLEGIEDSAKAHNTAVLLENQMQKGLALINEDPGSGAGTQSGQTANATGFDFSAGDGTGTGNDISPFQHYLLPLVRRVYPNLIANELVGVQPMTSPASLVFYLKYRYTGLVAQTANLVTGRIEDTVVAKGQTQPYTEYGNFIGNTWNIDPYYSLQTIFRERVVVPFDGLLAAETASHTLLAAPKIANTISAVVVVADTAVADFAAATNVVLVEATNIPESVGPSVTGLNLVVRAVLKGATFVPTFDDFSTNGQTLDISTAGVQALLGREAVPGNGDGGMVPANFVDVNTGASFNGLGLTTSYDYNMEGNRQMPEMELQVESNPVTAKTRKLRTKWTIEASQDLRAMHNIDAEQELIAVLANEVTAEIDREIINDLIVNASIRVTYDYSNPFLVGGIGGVNSIPGATNFEDRNKALFYQILEVSNQIYRQSLRGAGNWIVTSPEVASKLESLLEFKPDARTDTQYNLGIIYSGSLNGQFKVFKDPLFPTDKILVGFKGSSFMDAGYFYCPYVPLQLTPTVLDTESFNPRKGLITRYGKVMVENGNRMYGLITVNNLVAIGANQLPGADSVGTSPQISGSAIQDSVNSSELI